MHENNHRYARQFDEARKSGGGEVGNAFNGRIAGTDKWCHHLFARNRLIASGLHWRVVYPCIIKLFVSPCAPALKELETRPDGPWVVMLPKMPGHKEARYAQLLCGKPEIAPAGEVNVVESSNPVSPTARIAKLEEEVAALRARIDELSKAIEPLMGPG